MPILWVVIESGAVYSFTLIALLGTYLAGSWAQYLLIDALSPIIVRDTLVWSQSYPLTWSAQGIVFSFVIVHFGLGISSSKGPAPTRRDGDLTNFSTNLWLSPEDKPLDDPENPSEPALQKMVRIQPSPLHPTMTAETSSSVIDSSEAFSYPPRKWAPVCIPTFLAISISY